MMKKYSKRKQKYCRHEYRPWANIYGDLINDFDSRTIMMCPKCGKRMFIGPYIEAPINYNSFLEFAARFFKFENFDSLWEQTGQYIIKNKKQYLELFGDNL